MAENLPTSSTYITDEIKAKFEEVAYDYLKGQGDQIKVTLPSSRQDCPNCLFDSIRKKSKNIYNSSNSNTIGGPLHKPFANGQICQVCRGKGVLNTPNTVNYTALVERNFRSDQMTQISHVQFDNIKTITHIGSFADLSVAKSMHLAGYDYEPDGVPVKVGMQEKTLVRMHWKLSR